MRVKRTCVRSDRVTAQRQTNELRGGRARISGINRPCQKPFHAKFSTIREIMVIPDIMESTDPLVPATAIPYVNVSFAGNGRSKVTGFRLWILTISFASCCFHYSKIDE